MSRTISSTERTKKTRAATARRRANQAAPVPPSAPWRPLVLSLAVVSLVALALLTIRLVFTLNHSYFFIAWNLILAWIPLGLALAFRAYAPRVSVGWQAMLFIVWLLFFPNAPYIITDYIHLTGWYGVPRYFDILLVTSFAWAGLFLGFVSMYIVEESIKKSMTATQAQWLMYTSLFLASFGVFMGRLLRWNSWDVLVHPVLLAGDVTNALLNTHTLLYLGGMTLALFLFLAAGYHTFRTLLPHRYE